MLLLEAVDESLSSLGDSAKQSIYFHIEKNFKIAKNDIPHRFKEFADGLEKIFGAGAKFIEILIMKNLHEKIGKPLEWDSNREFVFVEYVITAKECFSKTSRPRNA
jgi:hypothetical protein